MAELDPRTATIDVERALQSTIAIGLRRRYPAVADLAALRAWPTLGGGGTSSLDESIVELVPVTAGAVYLWDATAAGADDGDATIKPTDRGTSLPGRWLKTASTSTSGYLNAVRIFEGEDSEEAIMDRTLGTAPAVMVRWLGETPDKVGQIVGSVYRLPMEFELWVASRNLRRGNEALLGSRVAGEADEDPGVLRMVGDLRVLLAGSDLGLTDGVDMTMIGAHRPKMQSMTEGQFIHALSLRVMATLRIRDADGEDVVIPDPAGLLLQHQQVAPDGVTLNDINPDDPDQVPTP